MSFPEKIIVRAFGDIALIRYIIGKNSRVAYLTDNQGLTELSATGDTMRIVGFPLEDIFYHEEKSEICDGQYPNWSNLEGWQDSE